jgi:hypothetical protein
LGGRIFDSSNNIIPKLQHGFNCFIRELVPVDDLQDQFAAFVEFFVLAINFDAVLFQFFGDKAIPCIAKSNSAIPPFFFPKRQLLFNNGYLIAFCAK